MKVKSALALSILACFAATANAETVIGLITKTETNPFSVKMKEGAATATMENCLQKNPNINLVYTINEPAAAGAYNALKKAGKEKGVVIV